MAKPNITRFSSFKTWLANFNLLVDSVGDLLTLNTVAKTSTVDAVNEVNSNIGSLSSLTTANKTSVVSAVNEVASDVQNAIAELDAKLDAEKVTLAQEADIASNVHGATSKTTPDDADELAILDSASSWTLKKLTWANLKATLSSNFVNIFANIAGSASQSFSMSTAAPDTNTTQGATTAFVIGQAAMTTPTSIGVAAVGSSLRYARADHSHAGGINNGYADIAFWMGM
jgi:hypothetical protein